MASKLHTTVDKLIKAIEDAGREGEADEELMRQDPLKYMRVSGMTRQEKFAAGIANLEKYKPDGWEQQVELIQKAMENDKHNGASDAANESSGDVRR